MEVQMRMDHLPLDQVRLKYLIKELMKAMQSPLSFQQVTQFFNDEDDTEHLDVTCEATTSALAKVSTNKRRFLQILQNLKSKNVPILEEYLKLLFILLDFGTGSEWTRVGDITKKYVCKKKDKLTLQNSICNPIDHFSPRVSFQSLANQERMLIEDILQTFQGFSGTYIWPQFQQSNDRTFCISSEICDPLRYLVERIIPISCYYARIMDFIQENNEIKAGRVNQALAWFFDEKLNLFTDHVIRFGELNQTGNLDLTTMWVDLKEWLGIMELLNSIAKGVHSRGGETLTLLHRKITMAMSDPRVQEICAEASDSACKPYFETLSKWIFQGIIYDPYNEFMVTIGFDKHYEHNWDSVFRLVDENIPSFLRPVRDEIYHSGKYLDAIRKSLTFSGEMPKMEESLQYDYADLSYLDTIRKAFDFANTNMLRLLVVDFDIINRLRTAKAFYTLEHGDLFHNLIETCGEELKRPSTEVCVSYLPSLVQLGIESSSLKAMKYNNEISVYLEKWSLLCQTSSLSKTEWDYSNEELIGLDAITLKMQNSWPIAIVLTDKAIKCYQMLFRHLFYIKRVYMDIVNVTLKRTELTPNQYYIKHCMTVFVSNCLAYMTQGTVELHWMEFFCAVSKFSSVEKLRDAHEEFQYKCLTECLLTSGLKYAKLRKTLNVCSSFAEDLDEKKGEEFRIALNDLSENASKFENFGIVFNTMTMTN